MNIQSISQTNFKGYDARPLKGFFMSSNCRGIAEEMREIGQREGFRIFSTVSDGVIKRENMVLISKRNLGKTS